jgi:flagellar basal body rod protein FlgG
MDVSLFQAAAAMNASSRWQEVISENLASNQIPGFKKQDLSFSGVQSGYMARPKNSSPFFVQRLSMPLAGTSTNHQSGELRSTGDSSDVALSGPGLLEVRLPDGRSAYTRDGGFRLSTQGQLVSRQGLLFMSETGPLQLDSNNPGLISISSSGDISQGGVFKGRLRILEFNDPTALGSVSPGLFVASAASGTPRAAAQTSVHQGFIENANTSSVAEMVNMINASRLFEANQKVIMATDERMGRLISDVGNPPA